MFFPSLGIFLWSLRMIKNSIPIIINSLRIIKNSLVNKMKLLSNYNEMLSILNFCTPAGTCTSTTSPAFLPVSA